MSAIIPGVLLALAAVVLVLHPIVTGREASMEWDVEELTEAQHRRNMALLALRDVEYDFHSGKLDEADYRAMKQEISTEALDAIDEEEAEWSAREAGRDSAETLGLPQDLEAEIAALRASIREGIVCPQCGHPNPRGSRFCGDCGSALPERKGAAERVAGGA